MTAMLPFVTLCFTMSSCLIIGASSSQQRVISCASFNQHSILALCWDCISARPMWLTIISVMFFHLWSYPSIYFNKLLALVHSSFNVLIPALTILTSYIFILYKIFHIYSTKGRSQAFSTCSSHILAVAVFYGSAAFMYLQPSSVNPMDQGALCFIPALCPC